MSLADAAALLVSIAGVAAAAIVVATTRRITVGIAVLLELWTAAGLLRLTADRSWGALGVAAVVILLRKALVLALDTTAAPRRPAAPASPML